MQQGADHLKGGWAQSALLSSRGRAKQLRYKVNSMVTARRAFSFLLFAHGPLTFMVCWAFDGAAHARDLGYFLQRCR